MNVGRIQPIPLEPKQAVACARIAAEEYGGCEAAKVRYLGGGSFGRAVLATLTDGQVFVVKLLRAPGMAEKEAHDLRLLRAHCPVPVPRVLFVRRADARIPADCYGMERIEGKSGLLSLRLFFASKRKREAFADEVTGALHAIHTCTNELFGDTMRPSCRRWLDHYGPFAEAVLRAAEPLCAQKKLDEGILAAMRAAMCKFDAIFCEEVKTASLIHGDLNIANIMVGKGGKLTGLIDPLNAMYADREYDLFQFNNLTGKRFFLCDTYIRKYGASERCAQKLAFYGLWNEVYCTIRSGVLVNLIMKPLVKNMRAQLEGL